MGKRFVPRSSAGSSAALRRGEVVSSNLAGSASISNDFGHHLRTVVSFGEAMGKQKEEDRTLPFQWELRPQVERAWLVRRLPTAASYSGKALC